MRGLIGRKIGMTRIFGDGGQVIPVTIIKAGPCLVTEIRTVERDGYNAVQLGFEKLTSPEVKSKEAIRHKAEKKLKKPLKGQFDKRNLDYRRHLKEIRFREKPEYEIGQEIDVDIFEPGEKVDVRGRSKGKGFTGAMKRHGFRGGPRSHGSMSHRRPASGGSTDAARTFKGSRRPGHMGASWKTVKALTVVDIDKNNHLLMVKGSVPGGINNLLIIKETAKKF